MVIGILRGGKDSFMDWSVRYDCEILGFDGTVGMCSRGFLVESQVLHMLG